MTAFINDQELREWIGEKVDGFANANLPVHACTCPHCGLLIRLPVVVRKSDIDAIDQLLAAICRTAEKNGITKIWLEEINAECANAIIDRARKAT